MNAKNLLNIFFQGVGAMLAFVVSLVSADMLSPLSAEIMEAGKTASGFLSAPMSFLFNAVVNAAVLVWVAADPVSKVWR